MNHIVTYQRTLHLFQYIPVFSEFRINQEKNKKSAFTIKLLPYPIKMENQPETLNISIASITAQLSGQRNNHIATYEPTLHLFQ